MPISLKDTANITTANWGTARNIQIGNAAKSVNGSGNVSWSLSEIGAAAASHTHGYAPTATGSSISIHADSDSSSTSEYLLLKAGHNELKIASSAGGTTVTKGQDKLTFNGNIVYHAGRKPTVSEIGAAPTSHNHTSLTGVTNIAFAAAASDSASMGIAVSDDKTYFDFNLSDDANADMWRWRFGAWDSSTSSVKTFNAMTLTATSPTAAKLTVSGTVQASTFSGALSGNASTATKLQTARTINGTNFDGTGNIVTSNWGTARNIQIGNTAKSVNGSANVTWTLGEIGAAASNHTHGLVNLNSEAFTGGNDLNTYNPTKTWVARTLNSTTNRPADYFTVVNFGANGNSNFQLAHSYANSSTLYVRGRHDTSGNYTPWTKIYTDRNKPTASEIGAAAASHSHHLGNIANGGTFIGEAKFSQDGNWNDPWYGMGNALKVSGKASFSDTVRLKDIHVLGHSGSTKTAVISTYTNPDRLEFFWSKSPGGTDWDWNNKCYMDANGVFYAAKQVSIGGHRINPYSGNGVSIIRPDGQEFSGLEVKELWIGPYSGASKRLSMGSSAPSSPGVGDVWIQI